MKRLMIVFAAMVSIAACTSTPDKTSSKVSDTAVAANTAVEPADLPVNQTMCFQKLAGTANQDTTSLKLIIDGDKVTGDFGHYPKEKDKRVGTISAIKDGELIKGQWIYMQEGMNDTLQVEFKLDGDKLVQKNYTVDPKTGREVFSEASVFNIEFDKIDCRN
ncbi:hypothetical protein [Daejeonella sp. JGW-45]|uniref:hypothetical protein n=1 Tax=Daejeonella sp. JGW-45 TaxID=3034148 RepID=UPI0023ECF578|nr:hypothetical protein [Daejeonella sp. JGW-45]